MKYSCELLRVVNSRTGAAQYYVLGRDGSGNLYRKSSGKKSYKRRHDSAMGVRGFYTKRRHYKGVLYYHHYTTVTYESLGEIEL